MGKVDKLLNAFVTNCNKWVCADHNSESGQPAAIFREIKKRGYKFEEIAPNRWAKSVYCPTCKRNTTHYKLLNKTPEFSSKSRCPIDSVSRKRVLELLENKDAFTGASITSTPEIDHKVPWTRMDSDINIKNLSDKKILEHFQLLTREHNLLKDRMCSICKQKGIRPPFMEIRYWYSGKEKYEGTCEGCGWYDAKKWKQSLNSKLK